MKNVIGGYSRFNYYNGKNTLAYDVKPSESFTKELTAQLKENVQAIFGELLVWKQVHFNFRENPSKLGTDGVKFDFGYWQMYAFPCILYTSNLKENQPIDCCEELIPGSVKFSLEFSPFQEECARKLMREYLEIRKIRVVSDYRFPVKIYSHGIDVDINIEFIEKEEKQAINGFMKDFADIVNEFNQNTQSDTNSEKGLIHSFDIKSGHLRPSGKITISMDTGSSGEFGLEYIFQKLNETPYQIKSILIK